VENLSGRPIVVFFFFFFFFACSLMRFLCTKNKRAKVGEEGGTKWFEYQNPNDINNFISNDTLANDEGENGGAFDPEAFDDSDHETYVIEPPVLGENVELVEEPTKVEQIKIAYAKAAKVVDVKALKNSIWDQISEGNNKKKKKVVVTPFFFGLEKGELLLTLPFFFHFFFCSRATRHRKQNQQKSRRLSKRSWMHFPKPSPRRRCKTFPFPTASFVCSILPTKRISFSNNRI
jgi:hypothetical protein